MSEAIRGMFDRIAPTYDRLNRTLSLGIDARWRKRAIAELGELGGARVLDLCSGTGDLSAELARRWPTARVIAADFARAMLAAGVKSGKLAAPALQADALSLPFADETFDAALCAFGVRNLDDTLAGLRETARVLRPGGRFAVLEFFRPTSGARRLLHAVYNRNVLPAIGGLVSGDRGAYRYLAASMEGFVTRVGFDALAREAGLAVELSADLFPAVASLVVVRKEVS